jgi:uncharacterized protein
MSEPNNDYTAAPETTSGSPSAEERQWAMFAHLSALVGGLITAGWAGSIGCFLGPLIIWQMKKETMPFVNQQAKEALNFNITLAAVMLVLVLLTLVSFGILFFITIPLMIIVGVAALIFIIIAGIKANEGVVYRYPFAIRLIK